MSKTLTISELARETRLEPATLRAWERRHGFPRPLRRAGGHRRYRTEDVEMVLRVVAERTAGATLPAAIARALKAEEDGDRRSFFADLRGRPWPDVQTVTKRTLTRLTHAVEDECAARAERGVLVGAFQQRRFYERARLRWRDLARGARCAVVFADFPTPRRGDDDPAEVPVHRGEPLEREWALMHLATHSSIVLAAREIPGQSECRDAERRFELVWSADPVSAREALETAVLLAERHAPEVAATLAVEVAMLPTPVLDGAFVTALTNRMIGYLER